jgi:sugar O-acyltransferase (sialic acid O-acetyltransferase NeuD family)
MKKRIALLGYGNLGKYFEALLRDFRTIGDDELLVFDDNVVKAGDPRARAFVDHEKDEYADAEFYVCLGYKHLATKKKIVDRLVELGRKVPAIVHPSSYVHPTVQLGEGSYLYPGVNIDRNTVVGRASWLSNGDIIAHDCTIGSACWFGASVTLCGHVRVDDCVFIGSGTTVTNDATVGTGAIIGLGTAVTKDVPPAASVIGNPMRVLSKPLKLV